MMTLLKKLLYLASALFIIMSLTFILMKAIPGDPFMQEKSLPKEIHEALKTHYGLNRTLWVQYLSYLKSSLCLDFGPSFIYVGRSVNQIIFESFPISALLGMEALTIAIPLGFFLGAMAATKQHQWQDKSITVLVVLGISIPSFILATLLQYAFALKLGLLPVARWDSFMHTLLPAISLAALPTAFITRLTRSQMIDVLKQDYIKTARSKGLPHFYILYRHAIPNVLIPIIGYLGQLIANILTGSFIVEKIYGIPGLGHWFITSVMSRDYTLIMGITIFYSMILLTAIFLCDLISQLLDPRIRLTSSWKMSYAG